MMKKKSPTRWVVAVAAVALVVALAAACKNEENPPNPGTPTNPTNMVLDAGALSNGLDPPSARAREKRVAVQEILTDAGELLDGMVDGAIVEIDSGTIRTR
jgi:hypothetical protein